MAQQAIKLTKDFQRVINNRREAIRVAREFKREKTVLNMDCFADGLETFDHITGDSTPAFKNMSEAETAIKKGHCGTSVCFAGRMALDPYFKKQGLSLNLNENLTFHGEEVNEHIGLQKLLCLGIPQEDEGENYDFVDAVFYGDNEINDDLAIDKKATLDRIIGYIKIDTKERYGVIL